MQHLHFTHPQLDFWVTVEVWERDGRYMATADLAEDSRDVGVGDTPQEAGGGIPGRLWNLRGARRHQEHDLGRAYPRCSGRREHGSQPERAHRPELEVQHRGRG